MQREVLEATAGQWSREGWRELQQFQPSAPRHMQADGVFAVPVCHPTLTTSLKR